ELQSAYERIRQQELDIKNLKFELEMEQGHVNILRHDNQMLRQMTVDMHVSAEQEEEYISNKLLKRISGLKKEKGELLLQVEQEEEYLTNTLQKKLNQLQKEKIDMENALEQEQEYIVNRLQKQLDSLRQQQTYHPHHSRENSTSSVSTTGNVTPLPPASPSST
ncbi:20706_t:CDS:2, partial [Racocetra persica]